MLHDDLPHSPAAPEPPLANVLVHAGFYLAHDLLPAMPFICRGVRKSILGETLWERIARALQNVQPAGPYPKCDVLTVFVLDNDALTARFDIEVTSRGAEASIVIGDVPRIKHAPICVDADDDVVEIARKIFAAGLPQ
jgi:hypothetical protein